MAGKQDDDEYVCTLDDASLLKAKEELYEDPKNRLGAVSTFREWVLQQKHITCPTGGLAIARFHRDVATSHPQDATPVDWLHLQNKWSSVKLTTDNHIRQHVVVMFAMLVGREI